MRLCVMRHRVEPNRLMPRLTAMVAAIAVAGMVPWHQLAAQVSPGITAAVDRARGLVDAGKGDDARRLLDSLVTVTASGGDDLAESLYWRAVLSESAADAERDWKRLVIVVPLSPRTPSALLRLGELEILRGRPADARVHFERIVRDFPETEQRSKAAIWVARSYFEERDVTRACAATAALQSLSMPDGELRLQAAELQGRCRAATTAAGENAAPTGAAGAAPGAAAPPPAERTASGIVYSVQLAAYNTRREANAYVARLAKRGIKARIDGDRKPFRVRVGRYDTKEEANAMLKKLKKQGQSGFLAELPR